MKIKTIKLPLNNQGLASANQEQSFFSRNKKLLIILTLSVVALVVGALLMPRLPSLHPVDIECQRLAEDIKNAKGIAWVGPHCDDDMSVAGLLALASLEYKKNTYALSLKSTPGVDWVAPEVRFQDNEDFKNFLRLQEYFRWHIEKIPDPEKKQALFDFLDSYLQQRNIELLLTFEPTNGYYGHRDHKMVGKWLTEYVKGKNIKLYYVLNLDPAVQDIWPGSDNDPEPYSDIIKLEEYRANSYLGKATLWDTKVEVLKIYESSVQAASRFLENLSKFQRYEYYRKVQ